MKGIKTNHTNFALKPQYYQHIKMGTGEALSHQHSAHTTHKYAKILIGFWSFRAIRPL